VLQRHDVGAKAHDVALLDLKLDRRWHGHLRTRS
jgi:hypothetical protein